VAYAALRDTLYDRDDPRHPLTAGATVARLLLVVIASGVRADPFVEYMKQCAGVVKWRVAVTISQEFVTAPTALEGTIPTGELS
jgi:hypothetical protein